VGGVLFLGVCFARAIRRRYTADAHLGVELCELYWHFLGGVWIILVLTLYWVL
jgi:cytochrome c oxidase subunit 3